MNPTANAFRKAVESADHAGMVACLSDDIVFHSPVTFKPFVGKDAVSVLFKVLLDVFKDFTYVDEAEGPNVSMLHFNTTVGDKLVDGIDILQYGADGLINDFTVMVRPLSAATALGDAVGRGLGLIP